MFGISPLAYFLLTTGALIATIIVPTCLSYWLTRMLSKGFYCHPQKKLPYFLLSLLGSILSWLSFYFGVELLIPVMHFKELITVGFRLIYDFLGSVIFLSILNLIVRLWKKNIR